jgi:hypothetical protein
VNDDGKAMLVDVGISRILQKAGISAFCEANPATADGWRWKAPELMTTSPKEEGTSILTEATDIYAFGCVAYQVQCIRLLARSFSVIF